MQRGESEVESADEYISRLREENGDDLDRALCLPGEQFDADYIQRLMSTPIRLENFVPLKRSEIYRHGT